MSLDRRSLLRSMAAAAATAALGSACRHPAALVPGSEPRPGRRRKLAPVRVAPERVIREVTGLRPFRRSGFRVEAEPLGDRLLIHNYGHGGGGVSISWGSAQLAVEQALASPHRQAAVLGAGAIGLATARLLQDHGFGVTIYTRELPPDTTSNLAGAQWAPVSLVERERVTPEFRERYLRAAKFSFRYFQTMAGDRYGVRWLENYFLYRSPAALVHDEWEMETLYAEVFRPEDLLPGEHPFPVPTVRRFLSMHIDTNQYLRQVLEDVRLAGGRVVVREFAAPAALAELPEPLLINCTGLGAAALFGDRELVPLKGQLVVLAPQPEVDYITVGPGPGVMYMMPRRDGIVLGGTFIEGDWSSAPDPVQRTRILESQGRLFSSLR